MTDAIQYTLTVPLPPSDAFSLFGRHGEGAADYRAALASEQGWPYILARYAAAAD